MKKIFLLFTLLWFHQKLFAQTVGNVGIGTYYPDPSAALDIYATNKGVLFPRIFLQSTTDAGAIQNPERGLLIFNTNPGLLEKEGFYFNIGTPASPSWKSLEDNLQLPFNQVGTSSGVLFSLFNTATTSNTTAAWGYAGTGQAVAGISSNGTALLGFSNETGIGVFASSPAGLAMEVIGKLKITGANVAPGNGKVLTSFDASGNAHWATPIDPYDNLFNGFQSNGVLGGGNQNMSENTFVKIAFANQSYDIGANYNDANMSPHSSFIAPKDGIYHFDAMIKWEKVDINSPFVPTMKLVRIRGGVTTELSENRSSSQNGLHTSHIALDCELQQGDIVNVIARSYAPQVALAMDASSAHFNGHLAIEL
ncbi:hypothetical protein L0663_04655 [Dyadobacter sp. CY107]|uniref:hypothetical protein n=1 Tax=Dyadobacter fanqingshengii TaxID=2906443 RepID=UPI001F256931|nr:hypothetical protein [Dyadobacter fanqingshengii]MCF2502655.1 hypothetical protein [Dyadobacter fanqingshengii]